MFIDYVKIHVKGGDGGNGCISFRREKFVPRGGPDGGDGGNGGSVFLEADPRLTTLLDLKNRPLHRAGKGQHGKGKNMSGRNGRDVVIKVPLGTIVSENDNQLMDIVAPGQRFCAAKGGDGGRGNQHYATPTRQAPRYAEKGKPGEERSLTLELKIIADVGIIGLPNAGKSTLLSHITSATPRIAPYPFTTIHPNLGIYEKKISGEHVVFADIPGLIEGASRGAGLGDRFLRHIERTRILVHLIAFDELTQNFSALYEKYEMVLHELSVYSDRLPQKPQILLLNKIDLVSPRQVNDAVQGFKKRKLAVLPISAKEKKGLDALLSRIEEILEDIPAADIADSD
ncbi:GTPase ObgE [Candidatus Sumerlaeota bacterium]|nr:GTPase ObgE [Candidatus Sumerlaeota bacterium]